MTTDINKIKHWSVHVQGFEQGNPAIARNKMYAA
jgi:hypothetical protein